MSKASALPNTRKFSCFLVAQHRRQPDVSVQPWVTLLQPSIVDIGDAGDRYLVLVEILRALPTIIISVFHLISTEHCFMMSQRDNLVLEDSESPKLRNYKDLISSLRNCQLLKTSSILPILTDMGMALWHFALAVGLSACFHAVHTVYLTRPRRLTSSSSRIGS